MAYFAARVGKSPLGAPHPVQLWPEGSGWTVVWPAPPPGVSTIVIFQGEAAPLAELQRVDATKRRCLVPGEAVGGLRLAWMCGEELGPLSVVLARPKQNVADSINRAAGWPSPPAFSRPLSRHQERGNGYASCPLCQGPLEEVQG
nr:hypothetical protein [Ardenticatenales bacterium]